MQCLAFPVEGAEGTGQEEGSLSPSWWAASSSYHSAAGVIFRDICWCSPFQVVVTPLWTISLGLSVPLLRADSQWVSQTFQRSTSQPCQHHGRLPAYQSCLWLLAFHLGSLSAPEGPFLLASSGCGALPIRLSLPEPRRAISCLLHSAAVPCPPPSASCLCFSLDRWQPPGPPAVHKVHLLQRGESYPWRKPSDFPGYFPHRSSPSTLGNSLGLLITPLQINCNCCFS